MLEGEDKTMLEQVAKKSLIISIILILLAAIISVSVLSINNVAYAEEEEPEEVVTVYATSGNFTVSEKNAYVSLANVGSTILFGVRLYISDTAENVTIGGGLSNSKIVIGQRDTDLNLTLHGNISGYDQEIVIYNQSTNGTVHIINGTTSTLNISGKKRWTGDMEEGSGLSGIVVSKGNISFEGGPININGGTTQWGTLLGNLDFGFSGLQVFGAKDVYFKTNVTITGGDGARGTSAGSFNSDGGHGGYAFDGAAARVHVPTSGHLTLKGGKGGDGANASSGLPGGKGIGGMPYYLALLTTDRARITTSNGANGAKGKTL